MRLAKLSLPLTAAVAALNAQTVRAVPPDQTVRYRIREVPEEENSDIVFEVALALTTKEQDGDSVGWKIRQAVLVQDPGDPEERSWTDLTPIGSELWWVDHADPDDPQPEEFDVTPYLESTAEADDPDDPDLRYDFQGYTYVPPPDPFNGQATSLTYWMMLVGEVAPEEEGEDELAEVYFPQESI